MKNSEFITKVKLKNTKVSHNELINTVFKFPITKFRKLENLDVILSDNKISNFVDAKSLIFYIEKKSRQLEVKDATTKLNQEKKKLQETVNFYANQVANDEKLKELTSRALGFDSSKGNTCIACGHNPTANGICGC